MGNRLLILLNANLTDDQAVQAYARSCRSEIARIEQSRDDLREALREGGPKHAASLARWLLPIAPLIGTHYGLFLTSAIAALESEGR